MPTPTNISKTLAVREFTDREEPQQVFLDKLNEEQRYRVLHFYGVGGIGKSSLQRHLMSKHLDNMENSIYAYVDFDNPAHRDSATALKVLSKRLHSNFSVKFPLFEVVFAIYWVRNNPDMKLNEETDLPFFEKGDILSGTLGVLDGIGLINSVFKLGNYLYKEFTKQFGEELVKKLKKLSTEPIETIKSHLSFYFTEDLKNHIENNKIKNAVLFIDTYEALENDAWIVNDFANNLPKETLLVTCGREKLQWEKRDSTWNEYLEQHILGNLSKKDCAYFLKSCGIVNETIIDVISRRSEGVPYYLDLSVNLYQRSPNPTAKEFDVEHIEIFERFMKYLSREEQETLKVLANGRYYTKELFECLIEKFKTYYPLTAFHEFNGYSFIEQEQEKYIIHNLMRENLLKFQAKELSTEVSNYLFTHYESSFKSLELIDLKEIESEHLKEEFEEASYHKKRVSENFATYASWVNGYSALFYRGAKYTVFFETLKSLIERAKLLTDKETQTELATSYNNLAGLYKSMGAFEKAEPLYDKALSIREKVLGEEHPDTATSYNNLAVFYYNTEELEKAYAFMKKAVDVRETVLPENHPDLMNSKRGLDIIEQELKRKNE